MMSSSFLSIHAARVGCDCQHGDKIFISIHAARVGCDLFKSGVDFNLRSPCRLRQLFTLNPIISIHAARIGCDFSIRCSPVSFSIHATHIGCDRNHIDKGVKYAWISIHAARVGCDHQRENASSHLYLFQFTQPV